MAFIPLQRLRLLLLLPILLVACDTNNLQEEFLVSADAPASRFTSTDEKGQVLSEDADDWRVAPIFVGRVRFGPAYPNPTGPGLVTIEVNVISQGSFGSGLVVQGRNSEGRFVTLGELLDASSTGLYSLAFNPSAIAEVGLFRAFVFDIATGELATYGDVLIE